ncbi:MAG: hypothetical protein ACKO6A_08475 [Bacteroidota bacterium]
MKETTRERGICISLNLVNKLVGKWPGSIIEATSMEDADEWCKRNTQYFFVEQELIVVQKTEDQFSHPN